MILGNYIFGKPVPQFFMYLLFDQVCPKSSKICSSSENPPIFGLSPPEFSSCLTKPTSLFTPRHPPHTLLTRDSLSPMLPKRCSRVQCFLKRACFVDQGPTLVHRSL